MEEIVKYKNGNSLVTILTDGTRTVETEDKKFELEYPLSIDLNISNKCIQGCTYCYQECTPSGETADLSSLQYLEDLPQGVELAINLQEPLPPGLNEFLEEQKTKARIVNCTVNQEFLKKNKNLILDMQSKKLIYGVGISVTNINELDELSEGIQNVVIHTINYITPIETIYKVADKYKMLVLGFKNKGRAKDSLTLTTKEKDEYQTAIKNIIQTNQGVIAFDNLSLRQLEVRKYVDRWQWREMYQGEEGTTSFFIDAVDRTFALNSLQEKCDMALIGDKTSKQLFKEIVNYEN